MNTEVTIIFVTYHSENRIVKYINKLGKNFKVIIVENSKNFNLKKKLKKFSNVKIIINKKNNGFGSAANLALKKIKTKYTLHLDVDTNITNKSILDLINAANHIKNFGIITAKINKFNYKEEYFLKKNYLKNYNQMKFVDGCCLLFNMKQMKTVGFFDKNFFLYFEETDLLQRCLKHNKKIFMIDNIKISHIGRSASDKKYNSIIEINRNWHYMWSKFYFHKKHDNYFYAFIKIFKHIISAFFKVIYFNLTDNKTKKLIYEARLSGCINSMMLKKSWYRPKIN